MRSLGIAEQMPFTATLTNPLPKGQIETNGTFGPWQKGNPGATPLAGSYSFQNADLGTIKGIGGILNSNGAFGGELERIAVKGDTHVPDFHLDISGQPVALGTSFEAVVDGTDGDTYLNEVNAQFRQTSLTAKGAVTGTKGVKGRTIKLTVHIQEGRIEDLLRLAVKGDKPLLVGAGRPPHRLRPAARREGRDREAAARGQFDVDAAKFTDDGVQQKLAGMSHRARGRDPDEKAENVVSDLSGTFVLKDGSLSFPDLAFATAGRDRAPSRIVRTSQRSDCVRRHAAHGRDDLAGGRRGRQGVLPEGRRSDLPQEGRGRAGADQDPRARGTSRSSASMSGRCSNRTGWQR